MTPEQLKELDEFISPLIKKGQPLSHIFSVYGDTLPCSRKTIYNYLDMGIFTVKNIDLPASFMHSEVRTGCLRHAV